MDLRAALLVAATASAFLAVACGGDGGQTAVGGTSGNTQPQAGSGGSSSIVDIHPRGLVRYSWATGVSGDQIVGWGEVPDAHALLWTSQGVVDLNPSGFRSCMAHATDGTQQVGHCGHAMLWSGTADSAVD